MKKIILICLLILLSTQDCTVSDPEKVDCGFVGINQQQCEGKNCCWQPEISHFFKKDQNVNGVPWCFYPKSDDSCKNINFKAENPGFDDAFYNGGGIAAAPDNSSELGGGSYWYHWMRDGALTIRTYIEINDYKLPQIENVLKKYVSWILKLQNQPDPYRIDMIEPKYQLNDGTPYNGGWCRGQTDGPGLRATALIMFANILLENGQKDYIQKYLWTSDGSYNGGAIQYDLAWLVQNWEQDGCDLWEENRDKDFFWNRMAFQHALDFASDFAQKMGDSTSSARYKSVANQIRATLGNHWNGNYFTSTNTRNIDGSVIHALVSFPGAYSPIDDKVSATIKAYSQTFCDIYQINKDDNKNNIPGVLLGRYQTDAYFGGNPWQLLTASLAELFYTASSKALEQQQQNYDYQSWGFNSGEKNLANDLLQAGDAVMTRIYEHVKNDNYKITEQIDKNTGKQISANYLTWSHANVLRALHLRKQVAEKMKKITN